MADLKRLKGTFDLAQLNHSSLNNDDTKAALEAAKNAYEAALADQEGSDTNGGVRNDGPVEGKQGKPAQKDASAKPASKPVQAGASTNKTDGTGDDKSADTDKSGESAEKDSEKKSGVPPSE